MDGLWRLSRTGRKSFQLLKALFVIISVGSLPTELQKGLGKSASLLHLEGISLPSSCISTKMRSRIPALPLSPSPPFSTLPTEWKDGKAEKQTSKVNVFFFDSSASYSLDLEMEKSPGSLANANQG